MAVGEEGNEERFYKVLLTYDSGVHATGDEFDEVAFAGYELIEFSDIYRFCHKLILFCYFFL